MPQEIIDEPDFQSNLGNCRGIFTFSDYLSSFLKKRLPVPVVTLRHPTVFTEITFDFSKFLAEKKIIQIGSWLRHQVSFYGLKALGYDKYHLLGKSGFQHLMSEITYNGYQSIEAFPNEDVDLLRFLDNEQYDLLLAESIVFEHIYDSSVNNTVIECIVRNTPIIINKLDAIIEYLGAEYPLYYTSLEEVPCIIQNEDLIHSAHIYLKTCKIKQQLTGKHFVESFLNSKILK